MYYSEKLKHPLNRSLVIRLFGLDPENNPTAAYDSNIYPVIPPPVGFSASHYEKDGQSYRAIPHVVSNDDFAKLVFLKRHKVTDAQLNAAFAPPSTIDALLYVKVISSASGNKFVTSYTGYQYQGENSLLVIAGFSYRFRQFDSSNTGHVLRFSSTADGTHGGGTEYTTNVTTSGTPGTDGYIDITIPSDANEQTELYFYCTQHSGMGGRIFIVHAPLDQDP